MNKIKKQWTEEERFAFATQRLRAQTIPNKRAKKNKDACRRWRGEG